MHFLLYLHARNSSIWGNVFFKNFYDLLQNHIFSHERESNILLDKWDEKKIENECILYDLVRKMLSGQPESRPNLDEILAHPFFWSEEEKLIFICDLSDYLEANGYKNKKFVIYSVFFSDIKYSDYLEEWAKDKNILSKSFDKIIDQTLV